MSLSSGLSRGPLGQAWFAHVCIFGSTAMAVCRAADTRPFDEAAASRRFDGGPVWRRFDEGPRHWPSQVHRGDRSGPRGDPGRTWRTAPQWFGEVALFDNEPRTHDALAETDAVLMHVSQQALDALLSEQPAYWRKSGAAHAEVTRGVHPHGGPRGAVAHAARRPRRLALMATGYGSLEGSSTRGCSRYRRSSSR